MPTTDVEASIFRKIGARIAELRQQEGWTQESLAERVERDPSYIARIETGQRHATIETLQRIAAALGVEVGELFPRPMVPNSLPPKLLRAVEGLAVEDVELLTAVARRMGRAG
jgi:transcriptional regulator with XRE-family HTH domain